MKFSNSPLRVLSLAGCCAVAANSFCQESELERMVVTAQRSEVDARLVPQSVTVIDAAAIEASSARHVVDVLRGSAGIQVSDLFGDGSQARIDSRGFGPTAANTTLVLVDGRRLNNPDLGAPDLNSVSLKDVEKIEVLSGSATALYGDQAVGGVVNIITRRPEKFTAGLELDAGSYDRRALRLRVANRHANGVNWRISAERRMSDNYRDFNEQHYANVFGRLAWEYDSGEVFAEYAFIDEDIDTPGSLFLDQVRVDRKLAQNPGDFLNTDTHSFRLGWRQRLGQGWELHGEYTQRSSDSDGQLSVFATPNALMLKRQHTEWTPRLIGEHEIFGMAAQLSFGADIMRTDYRLFSDVGITLNDQERTSVYAHLRLALTDSLTMSAGLRHADVDNRLFASTSFLGVSLPPGSRQDDDANAGELGLSWQISEQWRVFARVASNFRFANADEYSGIANFNVFPFPAPLPIPDTQTGISWDLGTQWQTSTVGLSALFFYMDTDDEIGFEPFSGQNFNIGDSRRIGVNLSGHWQLRDNLNVSASYAWLNGEMTDGAFEDRDITFVAEHSGRVAAHWAHSTGVDTALELVGISSRVLAGDFSNSLPALPGYIVANAKIAYQWDRFSLRVSINNLLDKDYSDSAASGFDFRSPFFPVVSTVFPAPGRNLLFTIAYSL